MTGVGLPMRTDLSVVVLKLRPYALHAGTIGIARSVGRLGVDVHVLGDRKSAAVARSRYVRSVTELPSPKGSPEQLAQWIRQQAPAGRPLLVPVDDLGATFVQQHADTLHEAYRFARLPAGLAAGLVDKATLADLAQSAEVPSPTHLVPTTLEHVDDFLVDATFPVVVKMRNPDLFDAARGVRSVEIADDAATVRELCLRHMVDGSPNCLLQEYIPGGPETVWMVNAYVDATSELRFAASGRKLRQRPPYIGATSLGICERNVAVMEQTARLVRHIGYRGILDIGWRFDARDGRYKLLDFNPRIGATFRLFVGRSGMDVLRACYLHMSAQALAVDQVPDGRTWINELNDLSSVGTYLRERDLTGREYLRSLRGVGEPVWLARDDLAPALSILWMAGRRALRSLGSRVGAPRPRLTASRHELAGADAGSGAWMR